MNATFCSACTPSGADEAFLYSANNSCLASCPDGFFAEIADHTCYTCAVGCTLCSGSADNCQECNATEGYGLEGNTCHSSCPDGTYFNSGTC